jgi:Glycosyl hydrolase family 20, catalytic domain
MQTMSGGRNWRGTVATVLAALFLFGFAPVEVSLAAGQQPPDGSSAIKREAEWRGVHMMSPGRDGLPLLKRAISEKLAPMGVNALIIEVNYGFKFRSHPELSGGDNSLRVEDARDLAETCRKHNIRLVPMFNCLGHQSWARNTQPLLAKHPELDETPEVPKDNTGIYCRSWCPLHPDVNKIVFALIDELIDAFDADSFHVGMDEVFLVANPGCSRCKGKDPAEVFAKAVNGLHAHIVDERKLTMLMWADRLLDDKKLGFGYGKWEASQNGTGPAIDRIPKDIIMCDWHYETRPKGYPSVAYLQEKGFRVLPSTWHNKDAALGMLKEARSTATPKMIGHLCTTWVGASGFCRALLDDRPAEEAKPKPDAKAKRRRGGPNEIVAALKACMEELKQPAAKAK